MSKYLLENQESNRLLYRKVKPEDYKLWLPFYKNPASNKYWSGSPENPKEACDQQFHNIFERYTKGMGGMNALIHKKDNTFIGMCGLLTQTVDGIKELEIGYSILPKFWLNGYAYEAASKCKQYAFGHKLSSSLISIIHVDNIPSQKVALKNGMYLDKTTSYKENPVHIYRVLDKS